MHRFFDPISPISSILLQLIWFHLLLGLSSTSPAADTDFFRNKTITYIVGTKPGGGYDTYARLIAKYLEKHLPETRIVVENVPGAGHIIAVNRLYRTTPDGLTIGTFNTGLLYAQLLQYEGVQFNLRDLGWIGKAASDPRVLVVGQQTPFQSIDAVRASETPLLLATSGVGAASHNDMALLAQALGLKVRFVHNYGGSEGEMAILRGDITGMLGSYSALRRFVENGYGTILLRVGSAPELDSSIPAAEELVTDETGQDLIRLITTFSKLGRLTAAPPGISDARLAVLREAYRQALEDPHLLAEADRLDLPIDPLFGEAVDKQIKASLAQTPSIIDLIRSILSPDQ